MDPRALKRIINSRAAYAILDSSASEGGTWSAGGCGILADALKKYCATGEIYAVYNEDKRQIEHFVFKTNGSYIDSIGSHNKEELLRQMREEEGVTDRLSIKRFTPKLRNREIPRGSKTKDATLALVNLFKTKGLSCNSGR